MSEISGYLLFIPIIFIIVVFHEFGHFVMAKMFKIEVEEFAIGSVSNTHLPLPTNREV